MLVVANPAMLSHFGLHDERDFVGKTDFDLFPAGMAEKYRADDRRIMSSRRPMLHIVELFLNRQGVPDWYLTNKLPIFSHRNRVIGVMGTIEAFHHVIHGELNCRFQDQSFSAQYSLSVVVDRIVSADPHPLLEDRRGRGRIGAGTELELGDDAARGVVEVTGHLAYRIAPGFGIG